MPAKTKTNLSRPDKNPGFSRLLEVCRPLVFEPHDIARHLDDRGRYEVELEGEFQFLIKLFHYTSKRHTRGPTWHERLELFLPLDGPARFRMGHQELELNQGDMLVVENFKLHHVVDFPGFDTRAIVISFMPDFVYSLGSPSHDYTFLLPFYSKIEGRPHVLSCSESATSPAYLALAELIQRYFDKADGSVLHAGCKVFLLLALYHLARRFCNSDIMKWEFVREQQRSLRLKPLFDHISRNYSDKLPVVQAATLVHMSQPQLMKTFKKVAGMTLVSYINHVRLSNGARLLRETAHSIAEIANQVGFADQSYFDKQFKRAFGCSPKNYRLAPEAGQGTDA